MKKKLIAALLCIMLVAALLPASALAADDGVYISVNGTVFKEVGQIIKCGNGTATLSRSGDVYTINLTDAEITKAEKVMTQDGITYYSGIYYEGPYQLKIWLYGSASITAPAHSSKSYYTGISAYGGVQLRNFSDSALTISGVDCGIESDGKVVMSEPSTGLRNSISASDCGIIANELVLRPGNVISSTGNLGVAAGSAQIYEDNIINLSPDVSKGYSSCFGIAADNITVINSTSSGKINVNVLYEGSGYSGTEELFVAGISAGELKNWNGNSKTQITNINTNINARGSKGIHFFGLLADKTVELGPLEIKSTMNLSGSHDLSEAVYIGSGCMPAVLRAIVNGANPDDIAFEIDEYVAQYKDSGDNFKNIYAYTDCRTPDVGAFYCLEGITRDVFSYQGMFAPSGGSFASLTGDGKNVIAVTAQGETSNALLLSSGDYPFEDIDGTASGPYKDAILWAVGKGITAGVTPVEFRPGDPCTRGQVVTFLWRALGAPEPESLNNPFVDVKSTSPYYKAILWAAEQGITAGFDASHFAPNEPCTRAQVVTFLWRTEGKPAPESEENPFVDVKSTSPYFTAILWAAENGITSGYGNNDFRPNVTCNRGQIVTFIYRDMKDSAEGITKTVSGFTLNTDAENTADEYHTLLYRGDYYEMYQSVPVNIAVEYSDGSSDYFTVYVRIWNVPTEADWVQPIAVQGDVVEFTYRDSYNSKNVSLSLDVKTLRLSVS